MVLEEFWLAQAVALVTLVVFGSFIYLLDQFLLRTYVPDPIVSTADTEAHNIQFLNLMDLPS